MISCVQCQCSCIQLDAFVFSLCRFLWLQSCRIQTTTIWIVADIINNIFTSIVITLIVGGGGTSHLELLQLWGDQTLSSGQGRVTLVDALMHLGHGVGGLVTALGAALEHATLQGGGREVTGEGQGGLSHINTHTQTHTHTHFFMLAHTDLHFPDVVSLQALDHLLHHILHACLMPFRHVCSSRFRKTSALAASTPNYRDEPAGSRQHSTLLFDDN